MRCRRVVFVAANPSIDRLYEVDRLTLGAIHRPRALVAVPGGKGLNAARAAARAGGRVTIVGMLAGRTGDWIRSAVAAHAIDAHWVDAEGETRTCVSILDRSTGEMTEIYEQGPPVGHVGWDGLEQIVTEEIRKGDVGVLALSGSLPAGAPADGFGRLARLARTTPGCGAITVIADTYGTALGAVLIERPDLVKINAAEAGDATGMAVVDAESAQTAAALLRQQGGRTVLITLGVQGAIVVADTGSIGLRAPAVRGAYPVGSGDAFLGGLAVGIARGDDVVRAARLGVAAGAANAMIPGAGELNPADLERFVRESVSAHLEQGAWRQVRRSEGRPFG